MIKLYVCNADNLGGFKVRMLLNDTTSYLSDHRLAGLWRNG